MSWTYPGWILPMSSRQWEPWPFFNFIPSKRLPQLHLPPPSHHVFHPCPRRPSSGLKLGLYPCYHQVRFSHNLCDSLGASARVQGAQSVGEGVGGFLLGCDLPKYCVEFGGEVGVVCGCECDPRELFLPFVTRLFFCIFSDISTT